MFFIPVDNLKALFFMQIYQYPVVWYNRYVAAFFEASVLEEVRFIHYLWNNITVLLVSKVQNKASIS